MRGKGIPALLWLVLAALLRAQGTAGTDAQFEYRSLVDMPTAGILKKGYFAASSDIMPGGVLVAKLEVGVFEDLSFGIGYGGANIIGSGSPTWYRLPSASLRFRFNQESVALPALTFGFDTQGKGAYFENSSRYAIKSPGLFVAGSKNFELLGYMSIHGCLNYTFEHGDGDNFLNMQTGVEKTIGRRVSLIGEYNFAFNDNGSKLYGKGNGYLNLGVRWAVAEGFTLGMDLRDLLSNKKYSAGAADRAIHLEYIKTIQ